MDPTYHIDLDKVYSMSVNIKGLNLIKNRYNLNEQ